MTFLRSLYLTLMALTAFGCASVPRNPCEFTIAVKVMDTESADAECRKFNIRRDDNGNFIKDLDTIRGCEGSGFIITNGTEANLGHKLAHSVARNCK